jgi:Uma2 family endonuclease
MSTVIEPAIAAQTAAPPGEQRFLLNNVAWQTYCALVDDPGLSGVRMTYDRGALEFMSPSRRHEKFRHFLRRMIEAAADELEIPIDGGGATTLRKQLLEKGLEPDECYYVAHESLMRDKDDFDIEVDPPPDLAIEVEITSSLLNKLDIYAALKLPEIWRFDGKTLSALVLGDDGQYAPQTSSAAFPQLDLRTLVDWIERRGTMSETALIREFREWVRENLAGD